MKSGLVATLLLIAVAAVGIGVVQPRLAREVHKVKLSDDVALVPPPANIRAMSLGYHAAVADLLWADLVYQFGLRSAERRRFPDVLHYVDAILALEPDNANVFLYGDTMLLYRWEGGTEADARAALALMDRGIAARPYDPEIWLHAGQYQAFSAVSFIDDKAEQDELRRKGALEIAHAVELGADPDRSLSASSILRRSGERDAALKLVRRAYAMSDDPELHRQLLFRLRQLDAADDDTELGLSSVTHALQTRWGFLSRGEGLLIGPPRGTATCAGTRAYLGKRCAADWQQLVDNAL